MQAIEFPQANVILAKDQPQYNQLPVHVDPNSPAVPMTGCFELTDEEVEHLVRNRKLWFRQLTFGNPFQPMLIMIQNPFETVEKEVANG